MHYGLKFLVNKIIGYYKKEKQKSKKQYKRPNILVSTAKFIIQIFF